ncbi:TrkH family potassium uptake protein [Bacillus sp. T33-2]|uniref:TrkH family potassium uptake protein n=1 Tax=Bacillus sp. T33-2 TaxID=2054168 RepID=UPI000C75D012|nr:TrkH family potassium uptake protein [Bacillus sp. T33-2]PLR97512.1 Ktr system potassium uptake protein D [Bacillus sp. T33-2]
MWRKARLKLNKLTPAQMIVLFYFLAVSLSTVLLSLPVALKPGVELPFFDALFTSASVVTVTGLATVSFRDTFSTAGIFILMFVMQFGGIGIMALGTFFWLIFRKKIGLKERRLIMTDQNQTNLSGLVSLLKQVLLILFCIEAIGAILLGIHFLKDSPSWQDAVIHGLFASVSATTNGGFDITGSSLIPYANDYFVQIINIVLLTLGAIGFPVLIETKEFLSSRKKKVRFRFSLFTKLTSVTFLGLLVGGSLMIYLLEFKHFFSGKTWHEAFFYSFFQSSTTRSGGLATMDLNQFSAPTLLFMSVLMFIGASPSSVGGGIRTTTFAINLLFLYHYAHGDRDIKVFKREIMEEDVIKSFAVTMMSLVICFVAVLILCITEDHSLLAIIFEVSSAFGTTGLSLGITGDLTPVGQIVIILVMFIGRIGVISFLLFIGGKEKDPDYHYPKERVIIG